MGSITRKLKKMGQFQVVVELANGATIFDSTNKPSDVNGTGREGSAAYARAAEAVVVVGIDIAGRIDNAAVYIDRSG